MRPRSVFGSVSGQTSLEVLFVIAFVIVFTLAIVLPYVSNQTQTNVSIQTKLAIFPLIEKNNHLVHISSIQPETTSTSLVMNVYTRGEWDSGVDASAFCDKVWCQIDPEGYYSSTTLVWYHNDDAIPFCSASNASC